MCLCLGRFSKPTFFGLPVMRLIIWEFAKIRGVPYFGVPIIRILLFGILYWDPLFSETPIYDRDNSRSSEVQ